MVSTSAGTNRPVDSKEKQKNIYFKKIQQTEGETGVAFYQGMKGKLLQLAK